MSVPLDNDKSDTGENFIDDEELVDTGEFIDNVATVRKRAAPRVMWNRLREEGFKRQKLLTEDRMRNEGMRQIVLQEFGHVVNVHDFENSRVRFKRDGVDDKSIVIVWKSWRLEHKGAVLTVVWNNDSTSLCTYRPGQSIFKYAQELSIRCPDTESYRHEDQIHIQLNKPIDTKTAWRAQCWPIVKDMITMVFKHSMLRATAASIYGAGNVSITRPIYTLNDGRQSYEVWLMRMRLGLPDQKGVILSFLHHLYTPVVDIIPAAPIEEINEATLTAIIIGISRIKIQYSYEDMQFFTVQTSRNNRWRLRFRFISQSDMDIIMQALQILKENGAF